MVVGVGGGSGFLHKLNKNQEEYVNNNDNDKRL